MAHATGWTKQTKMTVFAVLLVVLYRVIVCFENSVTVDTSEAFWMPHLVQGGDQLQIKIFGFNYGLNSARCMNILKRQRDKFQLKKKTYRSNNVLSACNARTLDRWGCILVVQVMAVILAVVFTFNLVFG